MVNNRRRGNKICFGLAIKTKRSYRSTQWHNEKKEATANGNKTTLFIYLFQLKSPHICFIASCNENTINK